MQKSPDELPRDVFEPEREMRMLINSVMTRVEGEGSDRVALSIGDLAGADDARRVARSRGRNGAVKRGCRCSSKSDDR